MSWANKTKKKKKKMKPTNETDKSMPNIRVESRERKRFSFLIIQRDINGATILTFEDRTKAKRNEMNSLNS